MAKVRPFKKALQYAHSEAPVPGFFSVLDELIATSPRPAMTKTEWEQWLKPGRMFNREGVQYGLKKSELEENDLAAILWNQQKKSREESGGANELISREQIFKDLQPTRPKFTGLVLDTDQTGWIDTSQRLQDMADELQSRPDRGSMSYNLDPDEITAIGRWKETGFDESTGRSHDPARLETYQTKLDSPRFEGWGYHHKSIGGEDEEGYFELVTRYAGPKPMARVHQHYDNDTLSWSRGTRHMSTSDPKHPRVRLIEEVQSDYHQQGRKRGYATDDVIDEDAYLADEISDLEQELRQGYNIDPEDFYDNAQGNSRNEYKGYTPEVRAAIDEQLELWSDYKDRAREISRTIEPIPFQDTKEYFEHELMKNVIAAVSEDEHYVAIVRGDDQVNRYDLVGDRAMGTRQAYNVIYPSVMKRVANKYGGEYTTVKVEVREIAEPRLEYLDEYDLENIEDSRNVNLEFLDGPDDPDEWYTVHDSLLEAYNALKQETGLTPNLSQAKKMIDSIQRNMDSVLDEKQVERGLIEDGVEPTKEAIANRIEDRMDTSAGVGAEIRQEVVHTFDLLREIERSWQERNRVLRNVEKEFPAIRITDEMKRKIEKGGVPLFAKGGRVSKFKKGLKVHSDALKAIEEGDPGTALEMLEELKRILGYDDEQIGKLMSDQFDRIPQPLEKWDPLSEIFDPEAPVGGYKHDYNKDKKAKGGALRKAAKQIGPTRRLYHVTFTDRVAQILEEGITPQKEKNWRVGSEEGPAYGGPNEVFSFDNFTDALRWASKMDWDFNQSMGTGEISIIAHDTFGRWNPDDVDPLSKAGGLGQWLKRNKPVEPESLTKVIQVNSDLLRKLSAAFPGEVEKPPGMAKGGRPPKNVINAGALFEALGRKGKLDPEVIRHIEDVGLPPPENVTNINEWIPPDERGLDIKLLGEEIEGTERIPPTDEFQEWFQNFQERLDKRLAADRQKVTEMQDAGLFELEPGTEAWSAHSGKKFRIDGLDFNKKTGEPMYWVTGPDGERHQMAAWGLLSKPPTPAEVRANMDEFRASQFSPKWADRDEFDTVFDMLLDYTGKEEFGELQVVRDPNRPGMFAAFDIDNEDDLSGFIIDLNQPDVMDAIEEVEFNEWPPKPRREYAEGGKVKKDRPAKKFMQAVFESMAGAIPFSGEEAQLIGRDVGERAYNLGALPVAGLMTQWYGIDPDTGESVYAGPFSGDATPGMDAIPGIIDETVSIPGFPGLIAGKEELIPELSQIAFQRMEENEDQILRQLGIDYPSGLVENALYTAGIMGGQVPVPAAWVTRLKSLRKPIEEGVGWLTRLARAPEKFGSAGVEFMSPIIDPKVGNYLAGTTFGTGLMTGMEMYGEKVEADAETNQIFELEYFAETDPVEAIKLEKKLEESSLDELNKWAKVGSIASAGELASRAREGNEQARELVQQLLRGFENQQQMIEYASGPGGALSEEAWQNFESGQVYAKGGKVSRRDVLKGLLGGAAAGVAGGKAMIKGDPETMLKTLDESLPAAAKGVKAAPMESFRGYVAELTRSLAEKIKLEGQEYWGKTSDFDQEMLDMYTSDAEDYAKIAELIDQGDYRSAADLYDGLDTASRDYVWDLLEGRDIDRFVRAMEFGDTEWIVNDGVRPSLADMEAETKSIAKSEGDPQYHQRYQAIVEELKDPDLEGTRADELEDMLIELYEDYAADYPEAEYAKGGRVRRVRGDPTGIERLRQLGEAQRGDPERAMLRVQHTMGGGVLNPVVEHTGDLIHRMSHHAEYNTAYPDLVSDKVRKVLGYLEHDYGFEREMGENIEATARFHGRSKEEVLNDLNVKLNEYADKHRELPVYNRPQYWARKASVAVGEQDWDTARAALHKLKELLELDNDEFSELALTLVDEKGFAKGGKVSRRDVLKGIGAAIGTGVAGIKGAVKGDPEVMTSALKGAKAVPAMRTLAEPFAKNVLGPEERKIFDRALSRYMEDIYTSQAEEVASMGLPNVDAGSMMKGNQTVDELEQILQLPDDQVLSQSQHYTVKEAFDDLDTDIANESEMLEEQWNLFDDMHRDLYTPPDVVERWKTTVLERNPDLDPRVREEFETIVEDGRYWDNIHEMDEDDFAGYFYNEPNAKEKGKQLSKLFWPDQTKFAEGGTTNAK